MATITRAPLVVRLNDRGENDSNSRLAHHGWFYYWRAEGILSYRGSLAYDFLHLAAAHPAVREINQRAEPIEWYNGREWETYRARYEIVLVTTLPGVFRYVDVEVLTSADLRKDRDKYRHIRREYREAGRHFLVFTEKTILVLPRLTNAMLVLCQAGEGLVSEHDLERVRSVGDEYVSLTLNALVASGVLPYDRAYAAALNLVARGELFFRTSEEFNGDTKLFGRG
ncbi:hypothetical protein FV218_11040 [Methylobacterium sp. WL69]|uniref:hypothetical protein n=1 Tax=Methylobacterium sp. WL69 TaxID=2603893 RepID=UPI0011CC39D7|nr:hypothetical protein [Methylobacterium sp. WL69]TXM73742.1 hypothetical protein FV218_11040 [Methylobacterium sp. WL69]